MTREEMEKLARYATDSYFANLSDDAKLMVGFTREGYLRDYIKTYEIAMKEVLKSQNSKIKEFGENSKAFK